MDTTQQAAVAAQGVPSQIAAPPPDDADVFQGLFDAGAFAPTDEKGTTLSPDEQAKLEREAQGQPEKPAEGAESAEEAEAAPEDTKDTKDAKTAPEPEEKSYESLDEYLKDTGLDPESFMSLPVTTKVDGKEHAVPLSELVKGYQLSAASYARMNEAAEQRRAAIEENTRNRQSFAQEQQQVRQALGVRIAQTEALLKVAQEQLLGDYNAITPQQWTQLRTENPGEYAALQTQFQHRHQTLQQQLQEVAQAKQQEAQAAKQARLQALPAEQEKLLTARPEWRDPQVAQAAQRAIVATGIKLGFTHAELQDVFDHRHLVTLDEAARYQPFREAAQKLGVNDAELLNMASEFAKLKAQTPSNLKRVRAAPKMAKPGARQARDPKVAANQAARDTWLANPRNEDAGAAYFESLA